MWDLIVSVPDHCLSFYFSIFNNFFVYSPICMKFVLNRLVLEVLSFSLVRKNDIKYFKNMIIV